MSNINVLNSNDIKLLLTAFEKDYVSNFASLFTQNILIVPSLSMKAWITHQLIQKSEIGISMGLKILLVDKGFNYLLSLFNQPPISSQNTLYIKLYELINEWLYEFDHLQEIQKNILKKIIPSFQEKQDKAVFVGNEIAIQKKIIAFCKLISKVMIHYGKYDTKILNFPEDPYPLISFLWETIFLNSSFSQPQKSFSINIENIKTSDIKVYLFCPHFLPFSYMEFLKKLSQKIEIYIYQLTYTPFYLEDILSEKEIYLEIEKQRNKNKKTIESSLNSFLVFSSNNLMSNLGRLIRAHQKALYTLFDEIEEKHTIASEALNHSSYEEFLVEDLELKKNKQPWLLLDRLKTEITLLKNYNIYSPEVLQYFDHSIEVHEAPTLFREVEILHENLIRLIRKNPQTIQPHDIIILAPDINIYQNYIKSIFKGNNHYFSYQIVDQNLQENNSYIHGLIQLIDIAFSRWDNLTILSFLKHPHVMTKFEYSEEQFEIFKNWVDTTGIFWGMDLNHRNSIIKERGLNQTMIEQEEYGTWKQGISLLIKALIYAQDELNEKENNLKEYSCDFNTAQIIGNFLYIVLSIKSDLEFIENNHTMSARNWIQYLICLTTAYFGSREDINEEQLMEKEAIEFLQSLRYSFEESSSERFSFHFIWDYFSNHLEKCNTQSIEIKKNTITFSSIFPSAQIPKKIVFLLGMNDINFPRKEDFSFLNLVHLAHSSYFPKRQDYDRHLFLSALMSAENHFIISFCNEKEMETKKQAPSCLVIDLIDYLDKGFKFKDKKFSEIGYFRHSFSSFEKRYFTKNSFLQSSNLFFYKLSKAYYLTKKTPPHTFIPNLFSIVDTSVKKLESERQIRVNYLCEVIKNPLKVYYKESLGISLKDDNHLSYEESFILNPLNLFWIKKQSLTFPLDEIFNQAKNHGVFPIGRFSSMAMTEIKSNFEETENFLKKNHIQEKKELITIELHPSYKSIIKKSGYIGIPPITIDKASLIGIIEDVCPQGILCLGANHFTTSCHLVPKSILLSIISQKYQLNIEPNIFFLKDNQIKKIFSLNENYLISLVHYFFTCSHIPSILFPDIAKAIVEEKESEIEKIIEGILNHHLQTESSLYLKKSISTLKSFSSKDMLYSWKMWSKIIFLPLIELFRNKESSH